MNGTTVVSVPLPRSAAAGWASCGRLKEPSGPNSRTRSSCVPFCGIWCGLAMTSSSPRNRPAERTSLLGKAAPSPGKKNFTGIWIGLDVKKGTGLKQKIKTLCFTLCTHCPSKPYWNSVHISRLIFFDSSASENRLPYRRESNGCWRTLHEKLHNK